MPPKRLTTWPAVLWLTGPSAAGKSTIADAVYTALTEQGLNCERLDGDTIRNLFPQTGFDRVSREAHIRKVGGLARDLEKRGITVIASFISPDRSTRDYVRSLCGQFIEIHVATPIAVCKQRDPKGLYKKAARGEITHMVGMDTPYEEPLHPELRIDTAVTPVEKAVELVIARLQKQPPQSKAG